MVLAITSVIAASSKYIVAFDRHQKITFETAHTEQLQICSELPNCLQSNGTTKKPAYKVTTHSKKCFPYKKHIVALIIFVSLVRF